MMFLRKLLKVLKADFKSRCHMQKFKKLAEKELKANCKNWTRCANVLNIRGGIFLNAQTKSSIANSFPHP